MRQTKTQRAIDEQLHIALSLARGNHCGITSTTKRLDLIAGAIERALRLIAKAEKGN